MIKTFGKKINREKAYQDENRDYTQYILRLEVIGSIDRKRQYFIEVATSNSNLPIRVITMVQGEIVRAIKLKHKKERKRVAKVRSGR